MKQYFLSLLTVVAALCVGGLLPSTRAQTGSAAGGTAAGTSTSGGSTSMGNRTITGANGSLNTGANGSAGTTTSGVNGSMNAGANGSATTTANGFGTTTGSNTTSSTGFGTVTGTTTSANGSVNANANGNMNTSGTWQHGRLNALQHQLNLSSTQQSQLQPVFNQEAQELQALHNDTSLSAQVRRQRALAIYQRYDTQVNAALTPEQRARYRKTSSQWRSAWQNSTNTTGATGTTGASGGMQSTVGGTTAAGR